MIEIVETVKRPGPARMSRDTTRNNWTVRTSRREVSLVLYFTSTTILQMGTRGVYGVRVDESDKLSYCHFDSYPSGLGLQVLSAARVIAENMETFRQRARDMRVVAEKEVATHEDIAHYSEWADTSVSSGEIADWYVLLRKMQGKLLDNLASLIMLDAADFILDSLFCEFGYIVNFDTCKLEIYAGQATSPHDDGRYGRAVPEVCSWRDRKLH